jgi:putative transposase
MPEHVHLLLSEPQRDGGPLKPDLGLSGDAHCLSKTQGHTLADALKSHKQGVSRRLIGNAEHFWQKRYYNFNIRNYPQFVEKLRYIHRNPVKQGLCDRAENWQWSSFRHYPAGAEGGVEIESEWTPENANARREDFVQPSNCPTQAKFGLEWATRPRGVEWTRR